VQLKYSCAQVGRVTLMAIAAVEEGHK